MQELDARGNKAAFFILILALAHLQINAPLPHRSDLASSEVIFASSIFLDEKIHCCVSQTRVIVLQEGNLVIRYNYGGNLKRLEPPVIKT